MLSEIFNIEKVFSFCEKVCYFFMINVMFIASCIPVLLFFMFVGISQVRDCLPLFLLCMLSVPPAMSALFFSMNRMLHKAETGACKDYWKGYRTDFWQKFKIGAVQMGMIWILWTNVEFFAIQLPVFPMMLLFFLLFVLVIAAAPCLYLLASRYQMKTVQLVKAALVITVTKPINTLGSVASMLLVLMAFELSAGTTTVFMAPLFGFLIVFLYRNVLIELEQSV